MDWSKLTPYNTDKRKSFEELCFQIALKEYGHLGVFTAIDGSGGDGGVEFYLKLNNSNEVWGWQCKYYEGSGRLSESGRKQSIEKSLETACRNHTNLKKWFLCLRTDLTADNIDKQDVCRKGERSWFDKELGNSIPSGMFLE